MSQHSTISNNKPMQLAYFSTACYRQLSAPNNLRFDSIALSSNLMFDRWLWRPLDVQPLTITNWKASVPWKLPRFVNKVSKLPWNWIISPWNTVLRRRWFDVEKLPIEKSSYKTRSFTDDSYFVSEATSFCEYDWKRVNLRWGLFLEKCYNQLSMLLE